MPRWPKRTVEERFWAKVKKGAVDECWEWTGAKQSKGYGEFFLFGKPVGAHNLAYRLVVGSVPMGLFVLHDCDNPGCVNPAHLHVGTISDNSREAYERGRVERNWARGERVKSSKLKQADVLSIRELYATGEYSFRGLGIQFGVSSTLVSDIVNRKWWKWL